MPNSGIGPGDACVLAIRPENMAIGSGPAAASDGNVIRGTVTFASYLGNTLRYDVEVERGQVVKADIRDPWHHEPFALGQGVTVSFPPSVTLAIADDAA
jgi:ABC-type Fe3+/spermidine/putrescine transport system ATPase subunit